MLRPDVVAVDGIMMGAAWYANYLKREKPLIITHSVEAIDTTEYLLWETKDIQVTSSRDNKELFNWTLKPTYYEDYILRGDWMLVDIIKHNLQNRAFYFSAASDTSYNLFLTDHLLNHGVVEELVTQTGVMDGYAIMPSKEFKAFNLEDIHLNDVKKSLDALYLINAIRIAYLQGCSYLIQQEKYVEARALFKEMERKLPLSKLRHADNSYEAYYEQVKAYVDTGEKFNEAIIKG